MTRDEILNIEEGRKMDELIAEKIMGWRWFFRPPNIPEFSAIDGSQNGQYKYLVPEGYTWHNAWKAPLLPSYSTDIGAAWEVVVELENNDFWWTAEDVIPNSDPVVYSCTFSKNGKYYTAEWDFTISLAICHAALLTIAEEK